MKKKVGLWIERDLHIAVQKMLLDMDIKFSAYVATLIQADLVKRKSAAEKKNF